MKTYIITEQDIERLRCSLEGGGDNDWRYISRLDDWEESLEYVKDVKLPYSGIKTDEL